MSQAKSILQKGELVDDKYSVILFIKQGSNAETYRVKGPDGKLYFLKLFNYAKLHRTAFDAENNLLEIEFLKKLNHKNIVQYKDSGEIILHGKKLGFLVLNFIPGETLAERISREKIKSYYDIKQIILEILDGLKYLHELPNPLIHNEITPQNIMLDVSGDILKSKIIDFGYARAFHDSSKNYNKDGLNLNFVANECFNNLYSPQSDIFSVGAVFYFMLYGIAPWQKDFSSFMAERNKTEDLILEERRKSLNFPDVSESIVGIEDNVMLILKKALHEDPEVRFENAEEFRQALIGEIEVEDVQTQKKIKSDKKEELKISAERKKGEGFAAIAGMSELKAEMKKSVIDILLNPEKAQKYGAKIPNGMILYGPPGCGKTFFVKHFAEEVGFNFMLITPASLKSRYVNASQENIAKMFKEAEKNAPTIIFIDEINELLPNRESDSHEMSKSAVNEMLAQMDRTGEKGIFIVGASNFPNLIDPAMLRAGRLEKKFYLSPPDFDSRKALFQISLDKRKKVLDFGIDYDRLATITNNFVSADIEAIVNDASTVAMNKEVRISMNILENCAKNYKPLSPETIKKYEAIRAEINGESINSDKKPNNDRPRIGFKP